MSDIIFLNNLDLFEKFGEIGVYISKHKEYPYSLICLNDKNIYIEDATDSEIYEFISKHIDVFRRKYGNAVITMNANAINSSNLTEILKLLNLFHIKVNDVQNIKDDILLQLIENPKFHYSINNFSAIISLQPQVLKKLIYKINDANIFYDFTIYLNGENNYKEFFTAIGNAIFLINNGFSKKLHFNISVEDPKFLRIFETVLDVYSNTEGYPYEDISYTLNIEKCHEQIDTNKTYYFDSFGIPITIKCFGMSFESLARFKFAIIFLNFIISKIPDDATELQKTIYLTNFVVNYFKYDYDNCQKGTVPWKSFYDLFSGGIGVCRDYATVLEELLTMANVNCEYVSSKNLINPQKAGHAFNVVEINSIFYWIDATWMESNLKLWENQYFLESTDTFRKSHGMYNLDDYDCPKDYPREEIISACNFIANYWPKFNKDDMDFLNKSRFNKLFNKINNGKQKNENSFIL